MATNRILLIDDDTELCELLREYLRPEGFLVDCLHTGEGAAVKAQAFAYSLLILDVMLPGMNGFDVLRRIREHSRVPVIMLTARGDEVDRIVGLEMGADDYLPKPFNPRELVARLRAVQRRSETTGRQSPEKPAAKHLTVGDLVLDKGTRTVRQAGRQVELTAAEFTLLEELLRQAGQVVSRQELVRQVLGRTLSPYDRSIDVHVSSLRRKLGHHVGGLERIKTIRGTGYQYAIAAAEAVEE